MRGITNYYLMTSEEINECLKEAAMPYEIWVPINPYYFPKIQPLCYYVSSYGRIFSARTKRIKSLELSNAGYYRVHLVNIFDAEKRSNHYSVHRIVLCSFFPIENCENLEVNHKDGNKTNNTLMNLEWVNPSENAIHAVTNKLRKWNEGDECSWAKINENTAREIAQCIVNNMEVRDIAAKIGCPTSTVFNIKRGLAWRNVYYEFNLRRFKSHNLQMFSENDYQKIMIFIEQNFYKHVGTDYRGLCYDIMRELFNQKLSKNQYVELCDYIEEFKERKNIISPFKIIIQVE